MITFGQSAVHEDPFLENTAGETVQEKEGTKIIEPLCSPTTGKAMIQEKIQIFAVWKLTTKNHENLR